MSNQRKRLELLEHRTGPVIYEVWRQDLNDDDVFHRDPEWSGNPQTMSSTELTAYAKANQNIQVIRVVWERVPLPEWTAKP